MIEEILQFWFGRDRSRLPSDYTKWFTKNPAFDEEMRRRFGKIHQEVAVGEHREWKRSKEGRLALVLLLDQFSRNLYRGQPASFAQDRDALELSLEVIEKGEDLEYRPLERFFLYLPLEHSEELSSQTLSIQKFMGLLKESTEELKTYFNDAMAYAIRHYHIVATFGRFPHRNEILGRKSTVQEVEFLQTPGSSF